MLARKISFILVALGLTVAGARIIRAQDATATAQQPVDAQQQQEEKLKLERKATAMLEQLVSEAQGLKLPENRIRVQITAGDMLWSRDQGRARGLFNDAGAAIGQMTMDVNRADREDLQVLTTLRRDLVLTVGRHDADLAYQLLRSTQPPATVTNTGNGRRYGSPDQQGNLEQSLLTVIASTDPKVAYQKAMESLDKGEYPTAVNRVLAQLQSKDKEAFDKLSSKVLSRLGSENLLASREAGNLALNLLRSGPRPAETSTASSTNANSSNAANNTNQVLSESSYHDLMDATITAALGATRPTPGTVTVTGNGRGGFRAAQPNQTSPPDDAQLRQNNARMLLMSLQTMLSQIDQYLPDRSQAVRQKLTEFGMNNNQMAALSQMRTSMQQGATSENLMTAASVAPPQIQSRLYQQAAQKAIDEGNTDRALQIANDHLDESGRSAITQAVDLKRMAADASPEKLAEIRQKLAGLPSDSDRVGFLVDLFAAAQKDNPKLALKFLDDARNLVSKRATGYRDFEDQIKVADAYATVDPKRSFDVLEPGIAQLNELLAAAAILNGFEVDVFRDGELPIQGGSELGNMVARFGSELASLSKLDFDQARMTADKFQLAEPRLLVKLSMVQNVLGVQQNQSGNFRRNQGVVFMR
jgi:hypothetical protein